MARRAWFLNFDAEAELADPSARTPSRAIAKRGEALATRVGALLDPDDLILGEAGAALPTDVRGASAWCPTPRALAAIARAGLDAPVAPAFAVLRLVNHRRFSAALGRALPGARYVVTRAALDAAIAGPSPTGRWLLKRPFGFAARGRVRVGPDAPDAVAERWIAASLATGEGLEVEPWVERDGDYGLHGYLDRAGALTLGEPTAQRCDEGGAWLASARAERGELAPPELSALLAAAAAAAAALRAAGYFGPFGVDAFRFRDAGGGLAFEPRCEINARYSMGWAVGMGDRRPDR
jgi:hypothetical protein